MNGEFEDVLPRSGRVRPVALALVVLALMMFATLLVQRQFDRVRRDEIRAVTAARANAIAAEVDTRLNFQIQAVRHTAEHIAQDTTRDEDIGERLARLQRQFDDFQALNWVDPQGIIQIVTPLRGNEPALGLSLPDLPVPSRVLARARETRKVAATPPLELAQGGTGFVFYVPVLAEGHLHGFVNGVIRSDRLLAQVFGPRLGNSHVLDIRDATGEKLFRSPGVASDYTVERAVRVADRRWILSLSPTQSSITASGPAQGRVILGLGGALALSMSFLSYAALVRQRALEQSEERFAFAMEGASEGLWDWNLETGEIYFSPRYFLMLGYRPEDMANDFSTFAELVHPDDRAHALADPHVVFGGDTTVVENEFRLRHKDGSWRNILSRAFVSRRNGRAVRMVGTHLDVTESHRQQRRLFEAERLTREGIEALPVGFAYFDPQGKLVLWNTRFPDLLPSPCATVEIGLPFEHVLRCIAPQVAAANECKDAGDFVQRRRAAIAEGGGHWVGQYPDGRRITAYEHPTSSGGFITVLLDVTERVAAEEALRQSQKRLEEAVRIARLGSWSVHPDQRLEVSPEACEILGMTPQQLSGRITDLEPYVHPDDWQRMRDAFAAAWKGGAPYDFVHRAIMPSGEIRTLRERGEILRDAEGTFLGMSGSVQDITEQARLESQLHQAQKMEAIGQLTGGLAHDFNNLLAVILGNAELLQEDFPDSQPLCTAIIRASRRGAEIAQRLLTFARRQPIWPEPVDIAGLARDIHALSARTLGDTIEVRLDLPDDLWFAATDSGQAENALLNLALNARDAMPEGGRLLIACENVSLARREADGLGLEPGDYVRLSVRDEGAGMSEAVRARAFDPFFTTKEHGKGTGLGLSMAYGFARQSNGAIEIESSEGVGTCVNLFLPRAAAPESTESTAAAVLGDASAPGNSTVLVIEDEPDVRRMTCHLLRGEGYSVLEAADADSALEIVATHPEISLLLSDVMLPGRLLGPALAEKIRRLRPELRVVFMSGFADARSDPGSALPPGAPLLRKPFRKIELTEAVARALRHQDRSARGRAGRMIAFPAVTRLHP
ncbi:PAS domain-containing protein [Tropicimonas sp. IMCC6043]|uniref:PAS domain-containing protein n=1 Tax=Tropicimonas sp. IMCC6043 TaxID=2510645 RepID=UPI00101C3891|nr:PAS domain-containing protein [Tropicimonas sp. IMCC6043]RYH08659.1 PAS domain S-box protein [Tropicimonas sp. IMCC6043]